MSDFRCPYYYWDGDWKCEKALTKKPPTTTLIPIAPAKKTAKTARIIIGKASLG